MKLVGCIVVAVLAACGDDGGNAGVDGNELRPDSNGDADFDGIKDDVDNCPISANAFQGNEDGDTFGDACDPCPQLADDNPPDGDGDHVGDACDPKPLMLGDRLAFFEGFHQGLPQGWDKVGTWSTAGDQLSGATTTAGHFALIVTDRERETVSAKIMIASTTATTSEVGLVDDMASNGTAGVACVLTGTNVLSLYEVANPGAAVTTTYAWVVGGTYDVKLRRENAAYTCSVTNATAGTASVMKSVSVANVPYLSGFTLVGATIKADWFLGVESL